MKTALRLLALLVTMAGSMWWYAGGHHTGWSKDHVEVMKRDPITEIEYPVQEKRFVPGVEYLAASLIAGGVLLTASFFLRKK